MTTTNLIWLAVGGWAACVAAVFALGHWLHTRTQRDDDRYADAIGRGDWNEVDRLMRHDQE